MAQLCTTFCDPTDGSLPGSSVHGIFQARIQKWVVMSFFRGIFDLGSNPVLLNCRQTLYPLSHQGYQNLFRMIRVIHRISGTKFQKVGVKKKKVSPGSIVACSHSLWLFAQCCMGHWVAGGLRPTEGLVPKHQTTKCEIPKCWGEVWGTDQREPRTMKRRVKHWVK